MQFLYARYMARADLHTQYRKGQHFYNFMCLHKVVEPESKALAEQLWNADGAEADALIDAHTDWNQ